ncbi:MAG: hypothetical protein WCE54_01120, partial [Ignavibacteriaceae bacterium]
MKLRYFKLELLIISFFTAAVCSAANLIINNNSSAKVITFGNSRIMITLDYNQKCNISELRVNGQVVISGPEGIFSEIETLHNTFNTLKLNSVPEIKMGENSIDVNNIKYGNDVVA